MSKIYNIYCDESRIENRDSKYMVIGALFVPRKSKNKVFNDLKKLLDEYEFRYELKWVKVGKGKIEMYKRLIDYFIANPNISFRCIVVNKTKVDLEKYHENDEEIAFFKFYYFMLRAKLLSGKRYYIFLDKKPTREKRKAVALQSFLRSHILLHREDCYIRHLQSYDSLGNPLIQLVDFLTGMISYCCNEKADKQSAKAKIVKYAQDKLGKLLLCHSTSLSEEKFNVFIWNKNDE